MEVLEDEGEGSSSSSELRRRYARGEQGGAVDELQLRGADGRQQLAGHGPSVGDAPYSSQASVAARGHRGCMASKAQPSRCSSARIGQ